MAKPSKIKNDKYKKARGGWSRVLEVSCAKCGAAVARYQKDGPGMLKRMYLDRFEGTPPTDTFVCPGCKELLGVAMTYKKENRPAIRLFVGAVAKQIVKA
ncbi:hypothetical protein EBS80_00720 [bacterium]|nr:hypothetical protein [bacterium]